MDEPAIDLDITTDPDEATAYPLLRLGPDRVRVGVPPGRPPLQPDRCVTVTLRDPLTREGMLLPALVARRSATEAEVHLIERWDGRSGRADRRSAIRVQPGRDTGIELHLSFGGRLIAADLIDIGHGGLAVEQPWPVGSEDVEAQVLLPGRSWPLLLAAERTRARQIGPDRARCGYRFVPDRTTDAEDQLGALAAWVEHFAHALAGALVHAWATRGDPCQPVAGTDASTSSTFANVSALSIRT